LAGEGLVIRTSAGYATLTRDRRDLAELYGLAGLLAQATLAVLVIDPAAPAPDFQTALAMGGTGVSRQAFARVQAQLAPFQAADRALFGGHELLALDRALAEGKSAQQVAMMARRYYRKRARRAGDILRRALDVD
jgi:hypothetical protein